MAQQKKPDNKVPFELKLESPTSLTQPPGNTGQWTRGICPRCGYKKADVDPAGILWCPACGYSKKGCYT